ncbi:hypothetical protein A5761_15125 [Mycolicibacterium setense]|uniref:hypothetical protein n=1 Tax=Mycolicibacterium setense TaxID=431269 RepID=UPI0007E9695F|nr:hypothetical protein [Mycolicibacterium setense]OBB15071.1 hypothetical protein A5761_15125 [Mycolicibacterium setense]
MTRQLPKPVAVPLGKVIFGAINGLIYSAGWVLMRWDDLRDEYRIRRVGVRAEEWLKDGAK